MVLSRVIRSIRKLLGLPDGVELPGLQSAEEMRKVLDRERARSDRTGDRLAVVAFTPRGDVDRTLLHLVDVLTRRVRSTDEVGWLDRERVCVVLPNTDMDGARKVADDVCLGFPDGVPPPSCTVFVYPGDRSIGAEAPAGYPQSGCAVRRAPDPDGQAVALEKLLLRRMPPWKRAVDVLGAGLALVLLSPLFLVAAAAVRLSSPGPVLFRQRRSGLGGRPFLMVKFRTMYVDAEARRAELMHLNEQDGPAFKIKNDPRVTAVGRFLRKTSLDELPQLWNVLAGDMSLVGPRPLPCGETDGCEQWQRRRLDVTPGITCIWQVWGRSAVSFDDWVRMDVQYIQSRSLQQDLKLLLMTVPAVLMRKGAH